MRLFTALMLNHTYRSEKMVTKNDWKNALSASYEQLNDYLILHVPQLIGALILMILGWAAAWVCSKLTLNIVKFVSKLWQKTANKVAATGVAEIKASHAQVISKTVFWLVILFFIAAAASSLGLNFFSTWLTALLGYVPQLVAAIFISTVGFVLGNIAKSMIQSSAETTSYSQANTIGNIVKFSIFFVALIIGVQQLGLNIQFITTFIIVFGAVMLFGVALAFGMGSQSLVANIVGARQAKNNLRLKDHIKFSHIEGTLVDITTTMLLIETEKGRIFLPARVYMDNIDGVAVINESSSTTTASM
ncbi:MAG: small-conductance mechanosensitive channel [Alphaproteobacteria bacterium]|jgi:small-conductance mechanosensitive channel